MLELEPFKALVLSLHHSPGVYALLIGSGLSRAAGIPTGWEITTDLARRVAALDGVVDHADWAAWFKGKYQKPPSYSEILDTLGATPSERREILHSYIEPRADEDARRPTKAHTAIARLVAQGSIRVIITTNFDRLLENALREEGVEPTIVASEDGLAGATPLMHARCSVIKVHGDYLDTRIKNTETELDGYSPAMNSLLDEVFDRFGLVVAGWSGEWDSALRRAILRAPNRRYSTYWAARGDVGPLGQDILAHRQGRTVTIADADSFFSQLADTVDALRLTNRPHPQSVAMTIALAKRYSRDSQSELEWTELLAVEADKIRKFIDGPDYPKATPTPELGNELVTNLVATSDILRRLCLIGGRWGTTASVRAIVSVIRSIKFQPKDGFTFWNGLRDLPACLCFYWTLLGTLARDDLASVRQVMHGSLRSANREEKMVTELAMAGLNDNNWRFLKGLENRRTPGSDFLFTLFAAEASDISFPPGGEADLFDQIEFLITAEFAHQRLGIMEKTGLWFWTPVGRYIWNSNFPRAEKLNQLESLSTDDPLLSAGLLGGKPESAKATAEALREHLKKIPSW